MASFLSRFSFRYQDYIPQLITCLKSGYSRETFLQDLFAGITVGVIALPLAIAFAIGSGVAPEQGLFTAIVAGFLISLLGGSRVQVGGPTGAYVIIVFTIIQKYGYDGLAVATLLAGVMLIAMGIARCGVLIKFIPFPVITGFTTGIALVIFVSQIKDFLGLDIDHSEPQFIEKCTQYCRFIHTSNPWSITIAGITLALIFMLRRYFSRIPGPIVGIILATIFVWAFDIPVETIESKFGGIPRSLPSPRLPQISYELITQVFPDAITIALLGAIESLLCAVVADGMTGYRHSSNGELVAQGIANIGSVAFMGIPATGAIARTSASIKMGAKTPIAGIVHAITILLLMLLFAPIAGQIPLSALSAVLIYVAWNMSELDHFFDILRGPRADGLVLLITFGLTVLVDLAVAVQVGVVLSAILFLKHMTDSTTVESCKFIMDEDSQRVSETKDADLVYRRDVPADVAVFEIKGPFFYSVADLLDEEWYQLDGNTKVFILRIGKVPIIDSTGIIALKRFALKCRKHNIRFIISGVSDGMHALFERTGLEAIVGLQNTFKHLDEALVSARHS